jgi:transposase InsO family protein
MDFLKQLPISEGFDSILVVADRFTKEARFIATKGTMTSTDLCQTVLKEVISKTGLPDSVTSDRGKLFVSKFFRELLRLLKIETRFSMPYHPQTDGNTERINQSLEGYLRTYRGWNQDDWVRLLPLAEFTYNNYKACQQV